jgi:uncharacterized protein
MMTSKVYFGSPRQAHLDPKETLPAKLDLILEQLHLRDRVKDELVCIKLHVGNTIGYSTVHPVFVRKVVQAIKDGGGKPFVADVNWDVEGCEARGYTTEVLGCPVYPAAGLKDGYYFTHERTYKNIKEWKIAGLVEESTFMINFAHVKGHPSCGFGGCIKNVALGCLAQDTRMEMHDLIHFDRYWFKENCPDKGMMQQIIDSCPLGALVFDRHDPEEIHFHQDNCNQCMRCLQVAPAGSLKIAPENFFAFQEACAISTAIAFSTFAPGKVTNLALANQMTAVCDCFGFTGLSVLPDAGLFGSDDIVAIDKAVLDVTAKTPLIEENIPDCLEVVTHDMHPFANLHGPYKDPYKAVQYAEKEGLGSQDYELIDVLPLGPREARSGAFYVPAK